MAIIALSGKAGVGKDTFAQVLIKKHGFQRIALADPLRELCARVFNLDFNLFNDYDKKDKKIHTVTLDYHHIDLIRHIVQEEWGYHINYDMRENMEEYYDEEFETPREIMRCIGTKLLRNCVDSDIWINIALNKINESTKNIVITDCRFHNERDVFFGKGALLILIKRNDDGTKENHEHDLGEEFEYDVVFNNDGTITEFQSNIDMWYTLRREELNFYRKVKSE